MLVTGPAATTRYVDGRAVRSDLEASMDGWLALLFPIVGWALLFVILDVAAWRWGVDSRPLGPTRWI